MAAQNGVPAVSPFPQPPEYAILYKKDGDTPNPPPPPPVQTEFTVFGEEYHLEDEIIRSLSSQGIKQLYPTKFDWKSEMKKLNRSVVAAFLDLIEILIRAPDSQERIEKLNDIQAIFINMHHLINEYRPLQARDTLKYMQKTQLEVLEETLKKFRGYLDEGREALKKDMNIDSIVLDPVPRPSALSGIILDSEDEEEMPVLKKQTSTEDEVQSAISACIREHAKPSQQNLRERMKWDAVFLTSK